jgi:hypothetical protein
MPRLPSLPRHTSDAWIGGLVVDSPVYTSSISAAGGTVVAATEAIYCMRAGATRLELLSLPPGHGDVVAVAVEPRRPGRPARIAVATLRELHMLGDTGGCTVKLPDDHGEIIRLMWAPRVIDGELLVCLHVRCTEKRLLLVPNDGPMGTIVENDWPAEELTAMATDGAGNVAYAVMDEDDEDLHVCFQSDVRSDTWLVRSVPAPQFMHGVELAVAGTAVAVSFKSGDGGVWLTRDMRELHFEELEPLRGLESLKGGYGGPLAFEGTSADAALFAAVKETPTRSAIVRVDARGRPERIADLEIEVEGGEPPSGPMIHAMVWDATRRTLWSAAGRAGLLCSTAPGAPPVLGEEAAKEAAS